MKRMFVLFFALIAIMASGVSVMTATDNKPTVHIYFLSDTVYDCDNPSFVTESLKVEIHPSDTPVTMWVAWRVDGLPGSVDQRVFDGPVTDGQIVTVTVGPLPTSGSYNVHLSATAYVTDSNYGQAGLDYNVGWPWGCPPKPEENKAVGTPDWGCYEGGVGGWYDYKIATVGEVDHIAVGDSLPLNGDLKNSPFTLHATVFFKTNQPDQIPLEGSFPSASECGTKPPKPPKPPVTVNMEFTFPCLSPDGLDNRVHAMQWVYLLDGNVEMAGDVIYFESKEGTLTSTNAKPGDNFRFWTFPEGVSLDEARTMGVAGATYVGISTVNNWLAGIERGSCTPQVVTNNDAGSTCQDCPPAICALQPGSFVAVANQFVGLSDDGQTVSVFATKADADASGLRDAGGECSYCVVHLIDAQNGKVYITSGATAYDIAVAIQMVEQVKDVPHFTNAQFAAAQRALDNWKAAGKISGWYSYQ